MQLSAESITVTAGAATLLDNVSLRADPGQLLGLIGPNGAGKTTLLRVLAGLRQSVRGQVRYDGRLRREIASGQLSRQIAYLAQRGPVAWPLTVEKLVGLGRLPHLRGWGAVDAQGAAAIDAALTDTDLLALRERVVDTLSGGELARALLARALAVGSSVLLADEPVAALDPYHQLQVMQILRARADAGRTVIVVLHELALAARFCDRLALLDRGRMVAVGTPAAVLSDENLQSTYRVSALHGVHDGTAYVLPWQRVDQAAAVAIDRSA